MWTLFTVNAWKMSLIFSVVVDYGIGETDIVLPCIWTFFSDLFINYKSTLDTYTIHILLGLGEIKLIFKK